MHILVTGGTGFIGSGLVPALLEQGHSVSVLSRTAGQGGSDAQYITAVSQMNQPVDAVVNLAGASLAGKRWSTAYKREIVDSRVAFTRQLGEDLRARGDSPGVWVNGSAIGFYGPRGDEPLDETMERGDGFAADLCVEWEQAALEAAGDTARVCLIRLGVVLDRKGGAYEQMAQPFRMGLANWVGSGDQWLSWIHRDDVVSAILFLLEHDTASGAYNLTAPEPVTSRGFCTAMRKVHKTFLAVPMPGPVMRLMVGEMADELLLSGQRVLPKRLEEAGFTPAYPDIASALSRIEAS